MFRVLFPFAALVVTASGTKKNCAKIKARIDTDLVKGTVTVKQGEDKTAGKWVVKFQKIDDNVCEDGVLNWHVHEFPVKDGASSYSGTEAVDECAFEITGNHYDPTFGCGSNSQFAGDDGKCAMVRETNPQTCALDVAVETCEIGDISGKLGQVPVTEGVHVYDDPFLTNIANFEGRSIIFHCGSPRVICANFGEVDDDCV